LRIAVSYGVRDKTKEKHFSLSSVDVIKGDKGLTTFPPEIDYNQTAMGLPPLTSAVFLIIK
jgi:hypothetical protein